MLRSRLLATALVAAAPIGAVAVLAQELPLPQPVVLTPTDEEEADAQPEGPDASVAVLSISTEDTYAAALQGNVTVSIEEKFGASFDVIAGVGDGQPLYGGAARVFWRDPEVGMVGVYGVGTHAELLGHEFDVFGVGGQGALYFDSFALEAAAGFVTGNNVDDDFVAIGNATYFVTDDLRVSTGVRYYSDEVRGALGGEYGLDDYDASFFASGALGMESDWQVLAGLKVDLGRETRTQGGGGAVTGVGGVEDLAIVSLAIASDEAVERSEAEAEASAPAPPPSGGPCRRLRRGHHHSGAEQKLGRRHHGGARPWRRCRHGGRRGPGSSAYEDAGSSPGRHRPGVEEARPRPDPIFETNAAPEPSRVVVEPRSRACEASTLSSSAAGGRC